MTDLRNITMPKWGMAMTEGDFAGWLVGVGDTVEVGQLVADVETDKITGQVESPVAGVVRRLVAEGAPEAAQIASEASERRAQSS